MKGDEKRHLHVITTLRSVNALRDTTNGHISSAVLVHTYSTAKDYLTVSLL